MSPGIVRRRTAVLNIPEGDCCGEAVEGALIPLIAEENLCYEPTPLAPPPSPRRHLHSEGLLLPIPHADAFANTAAAPSLVFPCRCRERYAPWAVLPGMPGQQIFQPRSWRRQPFCR